MQDYAKQLLSAINQYDADNPESVNHLRDLVCWISDNDALKKDKMLAQLLYIASQKMRVFGYNMLNGYSEDPNEALATLEDISNQAIKNLYRSRVNEKNTLDKSQMEVVDLFQSLAPRRLLVSAPTSYGKTFLMREIVFLNKDRYNNILLVFPTVALLLENARMMSAFVFDNNLDYQIIKTVDSVVEDESKKIFVFTPERALQLIASFPDLKIDFFFFDEVYKIDEDYCNDELDDSDDEKSKKNKKTNSNPHDFLNEDRGKTFRIALYLLAKSVDEFYLAGPNLNQDRFSKGMKRFLSLNQIVVKEINFEPTLRISVNAHSSKIEEVTPCFLPKSESNELVPIEKKVNDRIKNVVTYIGNKHYGKTLLYCTTPAKAIEYSNKLSDNMGALRAFAQVLELNTELIAVKLRMQSVEKFKRPGSFDFISEGDKGELLQQIASIVRLDDTDEYAKRFDNFMYGLMISAMAQMPSFQYAQRQLRDIGTLLERKISIPQVKAKLTIIKEVNTDAFWEANNILLFEKVRKELRGLMQFLVEIGPVKNPIITRLTDPIIGEQEGVQLEPPYDFEDYRAKVDRYVNENGNTLAIYKLTHNIPLSVGDYRELERVLTSELGSKEDYAREFGNTPFGLLVRKIAKLDHDAAMAAFSQFINDQSLSQKQITFVHKIINHIEQNGYMESVTILTKPPFDKPLSFTKLFDRKMQSEIMATINKVKDNAIVVVA